MAFTGISTSRAVEAVNVALLVAVRGGGWARESLEVQLGIRKWNFSRSSNWSLNPMIRIKREEGKELEISHQSQVKDCLEPPSLEESRKGSSLEPAEETQPCLRREMGASFLPVA